MNKISSSNRVKYCHCIITRSCASLTWSPRPGCASVLGYSFVLSNHEPGETWDGWPCLTFTSTINQLHSTLLFIFASSLTISFFLVYSPHFYIPWSKKLKFKLGGAYGIINEDDDFNQENPCSRIPFDDSIVKSCHWNHHESHHSGIRVEDFCLKSNTVQAIFLMISIMISINSGNNAHPLLSLIMVHDEALVEFPTSTRI
jgi:hypothetical protein